MPADHESQAPPLLELRGIRKTFRSRKLFGGSTSVVAAQDVSFRIERGEAIALVGESGSGKSTLARIVLRLEKPDDGEVRLDGSDVLAREPNRASLAFRRRIQMVFQDPFGSLNSAHTVRHHLARPILRHRSSGPKVDSLNSAHTVGRHLERPIVRHRTVDSKSALQARILELLETVGLAPPKEYVERYPYELSGGQRQRVAIARALAVDPDLLVADEPTSMLDVSIRMSILNLLLELKRERKLAILLITHDLASARYLADRVLVLFRGRVVEDGASEDVVQNPSHPYTRALLASIADAGTSAGDSKGPAASKGIEAATGCPFVSRCPDAMEICRTVEPEAIEVEGKRVRCHLYTESANARQGG